MIQVTVCRLFFSQHIVVKPNETLELEIQIEFIKINDLNKLIKLCHWSVLECFYLLAGTGNRDSYCGDLTVEWSGVVPVHMHTPVCICVFAPPPPPPPSDFLLFTGSPCSLSPGTGACARQQCCREPGRSTDCWAAGGCLQLLRLK